MNLFILRSFFEARIAPKSQRGANMVEYVLLLAFIAVIVLVAVQNIGTHVSSKFSQANSSLG